MITGKIRLTNMKFRCFITHNPHQKSDGFSAHHQHPNSILLGIILV